MQEENNTVAVEALVAEALEVKVEAVEAALETKVAEAVAEVTETTDKLLTVVEVVQE